MTERDEALEIWLAAQAGALGLDLDTLAPASADASFRRYFRVNAKAGTLIVMDAPPEHENLPAFLKVDALMAAAGVNVPRILAADECLGFAILSDLGRETYLDVINEGNAARLMDAATSALVRWQLASQVMFHHFLRFSSHSTPQCRRTYHSGKSPSSRMSTARS